MKRAYTHTHANALEQKNPFAEICQLHHFAVLTSFCQDD